MLCTDSRRTKDTRLHNPQNHERNTQKITSHALRTIFKDKYSNVCCTVLFFLRIIIASCSSSKLFNSCLGRTHSADFFTSCEAQKPFPFLLLPLRWLISPLITSKPKPQSYSATRGGKKGHHSILDHLSKRAPRGNQEKMLLSLAAHFPFHLLPWPEDFLVPRTRVASQPRVMG